MNEPKLDDYEKLFASIARRDTTLDYTGRKLEADDVVDVVLDWLRGLSEQALLDGATVAPDVIDKLIKGLQEGRL